MGFMLPEETTSNIINVSPLQAGLWHCGDLDDKELLLHPGSTVQFVVWIMQIQNLRGVFDMMTCCGKLANEKGFSGFIWRAVHPTVKEWSSENGGLPGKVDKFGTRYFATGKNTRFLKIANEIHKSKIYEDTTGVD